MALPLPLHREAEGGPGGAGQAHRHLHDTGGQTNIKYNENKETKLMLGKLFVYTFRNSRSKTSELVGADQRTGHLLLEAGQRRLDPRQLRHQPVHHRHLQPDQVRGVGA